nr:plasmid mobilization relaxosome protein MobC [Sphingomonas sp. IC081]
MRLDDDELAAIEAAADRYGLTFSSFVRAASLSAAQGKGLAGLPIRSVRRKPVDREMLARVLGQLGKIGNNLNQLAKNGYSGLDPAERAQVAEVLGEIRALAPQIMDALGKGGP